MTNVPEGSLLSQTGLDRRRPGRQCLRKQPLEHGGVLNHAAPHAVQHIQHHHITLHSGSTAEYFHYLEQITLEYSRYNKS